MTIDKAVLDATWKNQYADIQDVFANNHGLMDAFNRANGNVPMTEIELLLNFPPGCKVIRKDDDARMTDHIFGKIPPDTVSGYHNGLLQCYRGAEIVYLSPRNYKVVE
jgi:hypothetical protein